MELFFLSANVPLTKTISPEKKEAYPLVKFFTSHLENVTTPVELFKVIQQHAAMGHCLIKGRLQRPLVNEARVGATNTITPTSWICLDFDRFPTDDLDATLQTMGVGDITYVLQYSSSHGLPGTEGTVSAHVFMLLDRDAPAPMLKAWLMDLNLRYFREDIQLSRCTNTLTWPLDITTCQNDKLLYICPPKFKDMKDPLSGRMQIVARPLHRLPVERIGERHIDAVKNDARKVLNERRVAMGLKARTAGSTMVNGIEVLNKPNAANVTEVKECGDFIRLNINGGDSWAYWHPKENFELIYSFKGEHAFKTKEFLPGYYQDLQVRQQQMAVAPNEEGDVILTFRDLETAEYYNGLWNPGQKHLELYRAKNETQLAHWRMGHGMPADVVIPSWHIKYDPRSDWQVDMERHWVNTFKGTEYLDAEANNNTRWPHILKVICHMLGESTRTKLVEHFINWFACIFQRQHKPLTAWVLHGIEGTGKGYFTNKIVKPLLGASNFSSITVEKIEDQFNAWIDGKLFIFVDEVDVDDFREKGRVTAKLRNYITEPTISVRDMRKVAVDKDNYASFVFSSNRPQPVYIPPTDRRYNVGNFQKTMLPSPDDEKINNELLAFAEFLAAYKVDVKKANTVLHTDERERIKNLSITSLVETCNAVLKGDIEALWLSRPNERLLNESGVVNANTQNAQAYLMVVRQLLQEALVEPKNYVTRDELLIILQYNVGNIPASPNKFTSILRHNGIETKRIRKNGQLCYGLEVEWKVSDLLREEITMGTDKPKLRKVK